MKAGQKVKDFYGNKGVITGVVENVATVLFKGSCNKEYVHTSKLITL